MPMTKVLLGRAGAQIRLRASLSMLQIFGEPAVIDPVEECTLLRCNDTERALAAAPTSPAKLHFITTGNSPDDVPWAPGAEPLQDSA